MLHVLTRPDRARPARIVALASLLLLALPAGCRSAAVRAARQEALADQLVAVKAYPAAATVLGQATALDPDNPGLWLKLGRAQVQAGDPGGANQSFQRVYDLAPDSVEALENLVILSVRGGEVDRANRYMDPLLVLQPDDPAGLLAQGAIALKEQHPADALATADKLIAAVPDLSEAYVLRARALWAAGRRDEAVLLLRKRAAATPTGPDAIEVRALLVDYYRQRRDLAGVRTTALELHRLKPDDPSYALESARAFHATGRDDLADAILGQLARTHPGSTAILGAVIEYRRAILPPPAAERAVLALANGRPRPVVLFVANALADMGAPQPALALARPLAAGPVSAATLDAHVAVARALVAAGQPDAALTELTQVLRFDGGNVPALVERARLRLARRDPSGALADAQLAQSGDGDNAAAALLVAQAYAAAGNAILAQQAFAAAVQDFPDSYRLLSAYLDWLSATGRADRGLTPIASFARHHRGNLAAWQRYARLCQAAGDPCLAEAAAGAGTAD